MSGKRSYSRGSLFNSCDVPFFVQGSLVYDPPVDHTAIPERFSLGRVTSAGVLLTNIYALIHEWHTLIHLWLAFDFEVVVHTAEVAWLLMVVIL